MVGNSMFNIQINNRLKDIKGSQLPFEAVSIVAVGDLFQLQPVMDGYIFKNIDGKSENLYFKVLIKNPKEYTWDFLLCLPFTWPSLGARCLNCCVSAGVT